MVDRKRLPLQWKKQLQPIREKITAALAELPDVPELVAYKKGHKLVTYFEIERVMQLLEQAGESTAKNLFGQYSSKKMKDWADIKKAYEKDNIFLGEAGNLLITAANYDM